MVLSTERRAREARAHPDLERPEWPPRAGTKVALYLPDSSDPDHEYLVDVDDLHGSVLAVSAPAGFDTDFGESTPAVKMLFPGQRWGWGYDADLVAVDRPPAARWRLKITGGPVPVERRDSQRVPHRKIVLVRRAGKIIPAHMLDRSDHGMRCIAGRGAKIGTGEKLVVGVDPENGDIVYDAVVVWRRLLDSGLEFGLAY
jgi:hypothetical protein